MNIFPLIKKRSWYTHATIHPFHFILTVFVINSSTTTNSNFSRTNQTPGWTSINFLAWIKYSRFSTGYSILYCTDNFTVSLLEAPTAAPCTPCNPGKIPICVSSQTNYAYITWCWTCYFMISCGKNSISAEATNSESISDWLNRRDLVWYYFSQTKYYFYRWSVKLVCCCETWKSDPTLILQTHCSSPSNSVDTFSNVIYHGKYELQAVHPPQ